MNITKYSIWVINISIRDINGATGINSSTGTPNVFTYNSLSALALPHKFINFTAVNLGAANQPAYPSLVLNNTGNDDFDIINVTGATLVGTTIGAGILGGIGFTMSIFTSFLDLKIFLKTLRVQVFLLCSEPKKKMQFPGTKLFCYHKN